MSGAQTTSVKKKSQVNKSTNLSEINKSQSEIQVPPKIQFYSKQKSSYLYSIIHSKFQGGKFLRSNEPSKKDKILENGILGIFQSGSQVFIGFITLDKLDQKQFKSKLQNGVFSHKWQINATTEIKFLENQKVQENQIHLKNDKIMFNNKDLYSGWKSLLKILIENSNQANQITQTLSKFFNKQSFYKLIYQRQNVLMKKEQSKIQQKKQIKQQIIEKKQQIKKLDMWSMLSLHQKDNIQKIIQKMQEYEQNYNHMILQNKRLKEELSNCKTIQESKEENLAQSKISTKLQQSFADKQNSVNKQQLAQIKENIKKVLQLVNEIKGQTLQKVYFEQKILQMNKESQQNQKEISSSLSKIESTYHQVEVDKKTKENLLKDVKKEVQKMMSKIQSMFQNMLQSNNKLLTIDRLDSKMQQVLKIIKEQQKKGNQQQIKILLLKNEVDNLNKKLNKKESQVQKKQKEHTQLCKKLEQSIHLEKTKLTGSQKQISDLKSLIQKYKGEIKNYQTQLEKEGKKMDSLKSTNQSLLLEKGELTKKIQNQKEEIQELSRYKNSLQDNLNQEKAKASYLEKEKDQMKNLMQIQESQMLYHLFQGDVLHSCPQEKIYFKNQIESYFNKKIAYTTVLYRYDPLNPTNYHKYFDQHENICVLVKLTNGRLISGFSASAISTKIPASKGGIICSLTEKKTFKLIEGKRSVSSDTFFLIFGNSQLRLKHGDLKFFTNFGIANSFYDSRGQKYTVLSGEGTQREQTMQTFQVLKVFFR